MDLFKESLAARCKIIPRDYQQQAHDNAFALWDRGERGVLTRMFTGGGKTPCACLKMATWLARGPEYRVLVVSYETQLVWQFAQEIEDFLGITPGIEMEKEAVAVGRVPRVVVACRASLLQSTPPTPEQIEELQLCGITNLGACDRRACKTMLRNLRKGIDVEAIREGVREFNARPEVAKGIVSRVHKFDWRWPWLVVFDEAHRHARSLISVGHIVDWFEQNPLSRRHGMTATPKRGDGISIGHTMFPGVALDYPLYSTMKPCGVKDGWAVPYVQKYIEVEGVDFKALKKIAGDFDPEELERKLGEERTLATLIEPLLDMVGERRTLIFSPGVEMAKNVALYINARVPATCPHCQQVKWYARKLLGDGAKCPCGQLVDDSWVLHAEPQAEAVWGTFAPQDRKEIYRGHQSGKFQFLSVCGLCREGYNDPDIGCVAVFRPVSKKASSLAEQMKGRGCRPLRSLVSILNQTKDAEERCQLIAASTKPHCLIVDLVGITGLADCASTVQIYAEGLPDEVVVLAEQLLAEKGLEEEADVENVLEAAKQACAEEKERIRKEREDQKRREQEDFERRAKANAEVTYTAHDVGTGSQYRSQDCTEGQYKFIRSLGMDLHGVELTRRQASQAIDLLRQRKPVEEVASTLGLQAGQWSPKGASVKQLQWLNWKKIRHTGVKTGYDASQVIAAKKSPVEYEQRKLREISEVKNGEALTAIAKDLMFVKGILPAEIYHRLVRVGTEKRYSFLGDAAE